MTKERDELAAAILGPNDTPPPDEADDSHIDPIFAADRVLKDFVVIRRSDLPEVTRSKHDENAYYAERESIVYTSPENARMWVMRDVAVWQFIEREVGAVSRRRDELAAEFTAVKSYGAQLPYTQKLIDRIIELEGQAK